jgi:hypothetical protein
LLIVDGILALSLPRSGLVQSALCEAPHNAEFERGRIVERVRAGLARAKAQGKRLGRQPYAITDDQFAAVDHLSLRDAATALHVSRSVVHRWRLSRKPLNSGAESASNCSINSMIAA